MKKIVTIAILNYLTLVFLAMSLSAIKANDEGQTITQGIRVSPYTKTRTRVKGSPNNSSQSASQKTRTPTPTPETPVNQVPSSGQIAGVNNMPPQEEKEISCLVTIFNEKYNVESLKQTHTGGDIFICGTDMTGTYQAQHGNDPALIAAYKIP